MNNLNIRSKVNIFSFFFSTFTGLRAQSSKSAIEFIYNFIT